jgi:hypothetical protein
MAQAVRKLIEPIIAEKIVEMPGLASAAFLSCGDTQQKKRIRVTLFL